MGGVGKSALAAELAARLDDPERLPGGILWANLAEETPSLVAARWLGNYGYDASRDSETARLSRLATVLAAAPALVVLDNAQDASSVRKLLVRSPDVPVLVTTRKRSAIPPSVSPIILDQLSPEESIELLARYAGSDRIRGELEDSKAICALCGYLPLALTLTGAQLADIDWWSTVAKYRSRLEQNCIGMLSIGECSEDNVRLAFEVSYDQIREANLKSLFAKLSLFAGGDFSIGAVSVLLDATHRGAELALERLADLSLVLRKGEERYRFHDLLREYAIEKLDLLHAEEIDECKRRLVAYYRDYVKRFRKKFGELELERDNLLESIGWVQGGLGNGDLTGAMIDLVTALATYFKDRGLWVEAATLGETAFVSAESRDLLEAQAELATFTLSWMYYYQENLELAEKWARVGMQLYTRIGNEYGRAAATRRLGMTIQSQGDEANARMLLEEALETFRRLANKSKIADTLTALGYLERKSGNLDIAEKHLQEALEILESISDQKEISLTVYQLGRLAWTRGDLEAARSLHSRTLEIDISLDRTPGIAYNQFCLGLIEEATGNDKEALEMLMLARRTFDNMGARKRVKRIDEVLDRLKGHG
jgi:tetratricopeptide (TPR) repeat protein